MGNFDKKEKDYIVVFCRLSSSNLFSCIENYHSNWLPQRKLISEVMCYVLSVTWTLWLVQTFCRRQLFSVSAAILFLFLCNDWSSLITCDVCVNVWQEPNPAGFEARRKYFEQEIENAHPAQPLVFQRPRRGEQLLWIIHLKMLWGEWDGKLVLNRHHHHVNICK